MVFINQEDWEKKMDLTPRQAGDAEIGPHIVDTVGRAGGRDRGDLGPARRRRLRRPTRPRP